MVCRTGEPVLVSTTFAGVTGSGCGVGGGSTFGVSGGAAGLDCSFAGSFFGFFFSGCLMLRKSVFFRMRKLRVRPGEGSSGVSTFSGVSSGCLEGVISGVSSGISGQFSSGGLGVVDASSSLRDRRVDLVGVSDSSEEGGSSAGVGSGGFSGSGWAGFGGGFGSTLTVGAGPTGLGGDVRRTMFPV